MTEQTFIKIISTGSLAIALSIGACARIQFTAPTSPALVKWTRVAQADIPVVNAAIHHIHFLSKETS